MLQNDYVLLLDELRLKLLDVKPQIDDLADAIGLNPLKEELSQLEEQTAQEGFWNDLAGTQKILQRISRIKDEISSYQKLASSYEDVMTLVELGMDSPKEAEATFEEAKLEYNALMDELETKKLATLLKGEYDGNNAILAFHAGAGGLEAQDWAQMLYRMYTRWAERHGYKCKVLDYLSGEEGGVKSASILIEGENAYGFLKSEAGVHRLVRISPFDSSGRRHTSFASLEVMPEINDEDNEIVINDADLKIDTYRSGGAGGQHVNKTESAIRITHIPTGVVVACQNERSQHQNREVAMKMLKSKLIEIKERAHLERIEDIKGEQKDIGFGNQIRSYVFMPYTLVKDHRTGFESGNITAVMDGDIDGFINAYLKADSLGHLLENE